MASKITKTYSLFFFYNLLFSFPFIFFVYKDFKSQELTYVLWISVFIPQVLASVIILKKNNLLKDLIQNFSINLDVKKIVNYSFIGVIIPVLICLFLYLLKFILFRQYFNIGIDISLYAIMLFFSALFEEIIFRFLTFELMYPNITFLNILLFSTVFGLFHIFNPNFNAIGMTNVILAGVFLSLVYLRSRSILYTTIVHFFWNFFTGVFFGGNISGMKVPSVLKYEYYDNHFLNGGNFGFEGSIVTSIFFFILIFVSMMKFKTFKKIFCVNHKNFIE